MTFPASTISLEQALDRARKEALRAKSWAERTAAQLRLEDSSAERFLSVLDTLKFFIKVWEDNAAVSGIGVYAQEQLGDETLDIATEFMTMVNIARTARDFVLNNYPTDAQGRLLDRSFVGDDVVYVVLPRTAQAVQDLAAQLEALAASIE